MPLFLLSIFGWIKSNPIAFIQACVVACLFGLAVWFYIDYTGTKRANADLTKRVEQAEANYSVAKVRIDDFVTAQAKFEADLQSLRDNQIVIRGQVRDALKGLSADALEQEYRDNPVEAQAALRERLARLFGMFDHATAGQSPQPR